MTPHLLVDGPCRLPRDEMSAIKGAGRNESRSLL